MKMVKLTLLEAGFLWDTLNHDNEWRQIPAEDLVFSLELLEAAINNAQDEEIPDN